MQYHPFFPDTPAFIKILLNATFPLPHGVSPIPFPLCTSFEGTHGTAPQGATLGTRIDKYRSLIMPLVRQRKEQHSLALLYYSSSLALDAVGALRLHAPNKHIPLISTLFLVLHLFSEVLGDSVFSRYASIHCAFTKLSFRYFINRANSAVICMDKASDIVKQWFSFCPLRVRSTFHQTIGRAKLR